MKNRFWKAALKSISHSKGRFLSIFMIIFLGSSLFAGLRESPAAMRNTADQYLKAQNYADLTYVVSLGLTDEDVGRVKQIDGVTGVSAGYQADARFLYDKGYYGVTLYAQDHYDDDMFNKPYVLEGKMPEGAQDALIDNAIAEDFTLKPGDELTLSNDFGKKTYTICGICDDVRAISAMDRGTNSLGDGRNYGFVQLTNEGIKGLAVDEDLYDLRDESVLYTSLLVGVEGTEDLNVFTDAYDDAISDVHTRIDADLSSSMDDLYETLVKDADDQLSEAQEKYEDAKAEYEDARDNFESEINDARLQLIKAKIKLNEQKTTYYKNLEKLQDGNQDYASSLSQLQSALDDLRESMNSYVTASSTMDPETASLSLTALNKDIATVAAYIEATQTLLENQNTIEAARLKLDKAEVELETQEAKLDQAEIEGTVEFNEAEDKLTNAKAKIKKAQAAVDDIPKGQVYLLGVDENVGLTYFKSNVTAITSIARVFPWIFFLVAALVSLTAMTRMVEEQRGYCGVLRALGYSKAKVVSQYVVYALLATLTAAVIGMILGVKFFPAIIIYLYCDMAFTLHHVTVITLTVSTAILTILVSAGVTTGASLSVCLSELTHMPSVLMRPKAPKNGQRILLERIGIIWRHLSFSRKVTMRNIFRYKRRFLMSVIGIAGCAGLIVVGFGIKGSVTTGPLQYGGVFAYDALVHLAKEYDYDKGEDLVNKIEDLEGVTGCMAISSQLVEIEKGKVSLDGYVNVYTQNATINDYITMTSLKGKDITPDDDGVVLTQKAAEMMDAEAGDTIDLVIDNDTWSVKVSAVMKNYTGHYVYMSRDFYEDLTGDGFEANSLFVNMNKVTKKTKGVLENALNADNLGSVEYTSGMSMDFVARMESLNMIIGILTGFAAVLSFVVLYNLTTINVGEREREIATVKVLGFFRREYYDYIFRENMFLSVIGGLAGCLLGKAIHLFIIRTVEFESAVFIRTLDPHYYLYAFVMTMLFTYVIDLLMRPILRRVDMVESLKAIE